MADSGTNSPENDVSFLRSIQEDGMYGEFLDDQFNARDYANTVIQSRVIGDSLAKLASGISLLNKELHEQVSSHHEDLLSQATGIETLEGVLQAIQMRIASLMSAVERVRGLIVDPYNRIASRTSQLRRLQTTCDYLRRIIRILSLSKKLQVQLKAGVREITKAAQSLNELEYVLEGVDLTGIQVIEADLTLIAAARKEVEDQAKKMLEQGLMTHNQTQIGTTLQVFHNLGSLHSQVDAVISESVKVLEKQVREALDPKLLAVAQGALQNPSGSVGGPGRAAMPTPGNTAAWRAAVWTRVEALVNKLQDLCQKVFILEKVLAKKRDPLTHLCFIDEFCEDGQSKIFHNFWNVISSNLRTEFDKATQGSTHLRQAFEGEYPKLLRLYNDLWSHISEFIRGHNSSTTQGLVTGKEVQVGFLPCETSPLESLKSSLRPFENIYLSRSLSRLFDPINLVFPVGAHSVPSKEEVNAIIKTIASELNVASVDDGLVTLVSKNVGKTIKLYITKCEEILVTGPEAGQLSGGLTNAQIRNASIVNSLHDVYTGMSQLLPNLTYPPKEALDVLSEGMNAVHIFMDFSISLLLNSIMSSLENKIARIHTENFSRTTEAHQNTSDVPTCSNYILDIQDFISRMHSDYLALYNCKDFLLERLERLASRLLDLFVRHACLLRDISDAGKLKLAADTTQLEFAVAPLCRRLEDLGSSYKLLRAFRPLLFQSLEDIPTNPNIGASLPRSAVLHFMFSKAPPELQSPHTVAGWTIAEYGTWLDQHPSEEERLVLIKGTLEAYAQSVRSRGDSKFHSVYLSMSKLLN